MGAVKGSPGPKVRFKRGEQPGLSTDMGKNTVWGGKEEWGFVGMMCDGEAGEEGREQIPWQELHKSVLLERPWRGLSKTHDQTWRSKSWRDGKRKRDTGEQDWPLLVCKEPPVKMHSNCSDLFCFPQSTDMISSHKKPSVSTLLWHVSFDIMSQRSHFKVLFESQNWETAKQCPGMQTNAEGQILCLGNKRRISMMEEVYWEHFLL